MNKVIITFYASENYGSEYRAGYQSIEFAYEIGFDTVIIADLKENNISDLQKKFPNLNFIVISSFIKSQSKLYKYTDFLPQILWHKSVLKFLRSLNLDNIDTIWIQNGAQPWFQLIKYFNFAEIILWGPVGGGDAAPRGMYKHLSYRQILREFLRESIEKFSLKLKNFFLKNHLKNRLFVLSRTNSSMSTIKKYTDIKNIIVCPEILNPFPEEKLIHKKKSSNVQFIWVGQDVPRKNLNLAIEIFKKLKKEYLISSSLDIYGVEGTNNNEQDIRFHGWVPEINWRSYLNNGVLLITSYREGLPSVFLEAINSGLFILSYDVGPIKSLNIKNTYVIPKDNYPDIDNIDFESISSKIKKHIHANEVHIKKLNYKEKLMKHFLNVVDIIEEN